jgi:hypothetical protein
VAAKQEDACIGVEIDALEWSVLEIWLEEKEAEDLVLNIRQSGI